MATSIAPSLDPMARRLRHVAETPRQRLWKDLAYFAWSVASLPLRCSKPPAAPVPPSWWKLARNRDLRADRGRGCPRPLSRYVLHFEAAIEDAVRAFAASLSPGARVLDAGAGEGQLPGDFSPRSVTPVSIWPWAMALGLLGTGCRRRSRRAAVSRGAFDASLNVVTLEHVREPARVLAELFRTLAPGGRLLLIVPHEWEEHQQPHDYFRYTRYGLEYLLRQAGFQSFEIRPVGGFFRLLSRRLLNALQFFPGPLMFIAAIFFVPPALVLPILEPLDRRQDFTLGYICIARKSS